MKASSKIKLLRQQLNVNKIKYILKTWHSDRQFKVTSKKKL